MFLAFRMKVALSYPWMASLVNNVLVTIISVMVNAMLISLDVKSILMETSVESVTMGIFSLITYVAMKDVWHK